MMNEIPISPFSIFFQLRKQTEFCYKYQTTNMLLTTTRKNFSPPLLFFILIFLIQMAHSHSVPSPAIDSSKSAVHIVYMERSQDEDPKSYHLRTLSFVLGSDEAAKEALVYSYKTVASGFAAKLTPEQVEQISKQPGVLQVVPSRTLQLHSGPGFHSGPGKLH